jgi:hypothetical protein
MDRNKQRSRLIARDPDPLVERDESIVGAGHDDAVFAAFLKAVAQRQPKSEHQGLFAFATGLGAIVDAAMARIDDDHRP